MIEIQMSDIVENPMHRRRHHPIGRAPKPPKAPKPPAPKLPTPDTYHNTATCAGLACEAVCSPNGVCSIQGGVHHVYPRQRKYKMQVARALEKHGGMHSKQHQKQMAMLAAAQAENQLAQHQGPAHAAQQHQMAMAMAQAQAYALLQAQVAAARAQEERDAVLGLAEMSYEAQAMQGLRDVADDVKAAHALASMKGGKRRGRPRKGGVHKVSSIGALNPGELMYHKEPVSYEFSFDRPASDLSDIGPHQFLEYAHNVRKPRHGFLHLGPGLAPVNPNELYVEKKKHHGRK